MNPDRQRAKPSVSPSPHQADPRSPLPGGGGSSAGFFSSGAAVREADNLDEQRLGKPRSSVAFDLAAETHALQLEPSLRRAVANLAERWSSAKYLSIPGENHLALVALERSLGESPALAPSKEQVRQALESALRLLLSTPYSPVALDDALTEAGAQVHSTAHWHARRFLSSLAKVQHIVNSPPPNREAAVALLRRGSRLLGTPPPRRGGWDWSTSPRKRKP